MACVHEFRSQNSFFEKKQVCVKCGYETAQLGDGVKVAGSIIGSLALMAGLFLIGPVADGMLNDGEPPPRDPMEG